jgi:hypothetical protein
VALQCEARARVALFIHCTGAAHSAQRSRARHTLHRGGAEVCALGISKKSVWEVAYQKLWDADRSAEDDREEHEAYCVNQPPAQEGEQIPKETVQEPEEDLERSHQPCKAPHDNPLSAWCQHPSGVARRVARSSVTKEIVWKRTCPHCLQTFNHRARHLGSTSSAPSLPATKDKEYRMAGNRKLAVGISSRPQQPCVVLFCPSRFGGMRIGVGQCLAVTNLEGSNTQNTKSILCAG